MHAHTIMCKVTQLKDLMGIRCSMFLNERGLLCERQSLRDISGSTLFSCSNLLVRVVNMDIISIITRLSCFSPSEELRFGAKESEKKCLIILNNVTKNHVAFKVRRFITADITSTNSLISVLKVLLWK